MSISKNAFRLNQLYDLIQDGAVSYKEAGTLWSWGCNNRGQLAQNDLVHRSSPVQIPGTQWYCPSPSANLSSGSLKTDGTLWMWGENYRGSFGNNLNSSYTSSPVQIAGVWKTAAFGQATYGIKSDNSLWTWGSGFLGATGQNDTVHRSSPVLIPGSDWVSINARYVMPIARKSDGTLWVWGYNVYGQLGISASYIACCAASSPVQVPGTQWIRVVNGLYSTHAIKSDSTLWSWGQNTSGQLGINSTSPVSSPVQVPGTQWTSVSNSSQTTAGLKSDGTLWLWGRNNFGQLGNSSSNYVNVSSPIQVPGTQWTSIEVGYGVFATKTDGTLWAWGCGNLGLLGESNTVHRSSPVQIPGTQWLKAACDGGNGSVLAVKNC